MSSASADGPDAPQRSGRSAAAPPDAGRHEGVGLPPVASTMLLASGGAGGAGGADEPDEPDEPDPTLWDRPPWAATTSEESSAGGRVPSRGRRGRRGRRRVVLLLVGLCSIAVLLVGSEVLGRRIVTDRVGARLRASGITGEVSVSIGEGWRPVVLPALLGTGIDRLGVEIRGGTVAGLPVRRADYELRGLDADVSVRHGTVHVRSIASGDVRIEIDPGALESVTGTPMRVHDGRLVAGEDALLVDLGVRGDELVLGGPAQQLWGQPVEIPVVDDQLLPCRPRVRIAARSIVLACRGRTVPGVLRSPLEGDRTPSAPTGALVPPQSTVLGGTGGGTDAGPGASESTSTVVETTVPETTVPDTTAPETTVPETTVPDTTAPTAVPPA